MNQDFVLEIDPQEWQGAFETLGYYFETDRDLISELDISKATFYRYSRVEKDSMDVSIADRVVDLVNS